MIELIQFPWSPFCITQRRILEFAGGPFKTTNVSSVDRARVWRVTQQRYYQVPVLRDGRQVLFETDDDSQVLAKYLDGKLRLGLFPAALEGVQSTVWRHIEHEVEAVGFKLNDIYHARFVPAAERLAYLRHKERKFGRGCIERWREEEPWLREELARRLVPYEEMLLERPFLLDKRPRFVDFALYGVLANVLYTGRQRLPAEHKRLQAWFARMSKAKLPDQPA